MKKLKAIIEKLESGNHDDILQSIEMLREDGTREAIIPAVQVLSQTKDAMVRTALLQFFSDLKQKDCVDDVALCLKNSDFVHIHQSLVTACWQSGLDYSAHVDVFVDFVLQGSFEMAFEALSVVENMMDLNEKQLKDETLRAQLFIKSSRDESKIGLANELIKVLNP